MKPTDIILLLVRCLPHHGQMSELETESDAIRFKWRSQHFRVSTSLLVETIGKGVLIGDDASILLQAMLKNEHAKPLTTQNQ